MKSLISFLARSLQISQLISILDKFLTRLIESKNTIDLVRRNRLMSIKKITIDILNLLVDDNEDNSTQLKEYIQRVDFLTANEKGIFYRLIDKIFQKED